MAKGDDVDQFARRLDLVVLSIAELVDYRRRQYSSFPNGNAWFIGVALEPRPHC